MRQQAIQSTNLLHAGREMHADQTLLDHTLVMRIYKDYNEAMSDPSRLP